MPHHGRRDTPPASRGRRGPCAGTSLRAHRPAATPGGLTMTSEEVTLAVIDALEASGIAYMVVGSFSSNYYGIPRSTKDADFVIQFDGPSFATLTNRLGPDFRLDPQMAFELVTGTTKNVLHRTDIPFTVEFFHLSEDPHDQERFRRRQRVRLAGRETFLPTAEDVIIT